LGLFKLTRDLLDLGSSVSVFLIANLGKLR
jgi:hypothetical protein